MTDVAYKNDQIKPFNARLIMSLGIPSDPLNIHLWIVAGIAPEIIIRLVESVGSDVKTICHLAGISKSTINRKLKNGIPLTPEQGTRIYGVIKVLDATLSLHNGDFAIAMSWLHCPAKGLGGEKPANILTTVIGVQAVVDLIGRIEYGVII
ncbi:DUF2384 domain-containing protein [Aeromonas sp. 1805]|uniref:antitoxin Xre/MbcA/ParS toxin-binding domain-containing protein n=1 Tax=Aeromonas sp. 1805 TaxID=2560028 RepID=UPI00148B2A18|nr:antitoxin Xre/MbcA/ParS toxin-binding domain-containing protein [Aeromonas sp. 1805]QJT16799.1 DUF2384 domain-containing protein [Aeromonas sp. 1805]